MGRSVIVYVPPNEPQEADLMLGWATAIVGDVGAVVEAVMGGRPRSSETLGRWWRP
jgi:hypothetical protein